MKLAPALAFFVAFALAGTLAAKDANESGATDGASDDATDDASSDENDRAYALSHDSLLWGNFHPGASEAFYLELGDEPTRRGKVVFQQDDSAKGVITCFLHDAPRAYMGYNLTLQAVTTPAVGTNEAPQGNAEAEPRGITLTSYVHYEEDKHFTYQECGFVRARDLDWKQLAAQPDYFRNGFVWDIQPLNSSLALLSSVDTAELEVEPARKVTATLKPCTGETADCALPQFSWYWPNTDGNEDNLEYIWNRSDGIQQNSRMPESGFPKKMAADVDKAFYWNVGNAQNGTGIFTVHPLDDGSGSLCCFSADRVERTGTGPSSVLVYNETVTGSDELGPLGGFESIDVHTKARISHCSWVPSTLFSSNHIRTLARGWTWMTVDSNGRTLGKGKWTTGPEPCSSRSDSLCNLSGARLHPCRYQTDVSVALCPVEIGPKISLPTNFVGDASDAFFIEVGDHVKGTVFFQKDERNAAIVTCFSPKDGFRIPTNATVHLLGTKSFDSKVYSDVDVTASYSVLSDGRVRQDCSLTAYTEPVWKTLLSAEWNHMTWNVTLIADHQPRISTVGEPSPKMDCGQASDGGCKLLDFVGCVSEDVYSEGRDFDHCTFEGRAAAPAPM